MIFGSDSGLTGNRKALTLSSTGCFRYCGHVILVKGAACFACALVCWAFAADDIVWNGVRCSMCLVALELLALLMSCSKALVLLQRG